MIFARFPRAGQVKTRMIPSLGGAGAARLHRHLVEQTVARALAASRLRPARVSLWFTGGSAQEMTGWLGAAFPLLPQQGRDLGERMAAAFRAAWVNGLQRAVLIGSDCPALTPELIAQALAELVDHDLVLGPAGDGGYYLVGLRRDLDPATLTLLFQDIAWGSDRVLAQTLARATAARLTISTLQELHDIDRPEDLAHLRHYPDPQ